MKRWFSGLISQITLQVANLFRRKGKKKDKGQQKGAGSPSLLEGGKSKSVSGDFGGYISFFFFFFLPILGIVDILSYISFILSISVAASLFISCWSLTNCKMSPILFKMLFIKD